jgi:hypothetical protein
MHLSSPPYEPHVLPISISNILTVKSFPAAGLDRPLGFQEVEAPEILTIGT